MKGPDADFQMKNEPNARQKNNTQLRRLLNLELLVRAQEDVYRGAPEDSDW